MAWSAILAVALFFPVRQLIYVMSVRRAERKGGAPVEPDAQRALRKRATFTAGLLSFVFAVGYVHVMFGKIYGAP